MEASLRDGTFLVLYGDNLIRVELAPLLEFHRQRQAIATVALFESPEPWTGGVVETDATGKVTAFREKPDPKTISTNLINAGIYLLEPGSAGLHRRGSFRFREGCVSEIAGGGPAGVRDETVGVHSGRGDAGAVDEGTGRF